MWVSLKVIQVTGFVFISPTSLTYTLDRKSMYRYVDLIVKWQTMLTLIGKLNAYVNLNWRQGWIK